MKVALHIDQLWFSAPGGIGTYVWELMTRFLHDEGDIELAPFHARWSRPPPRSLLTSDGRMGISMRLPIRILYPAWDYVRQPRLPRELAKARIVHATNHAAIPPVRRDQKLVVTVHDLTFERYPHLFPGSWLRLYRRGVRVAVDEADAILVPSADVRDDLAARSGVDVARIHITPLASSVSAVERGPREREDLADRGIAPPYVLFVGTIEPRKNLVRLVRAYRRLAAEGLPHSLVLIGPDGWGTSELQAELDRGGAGRIVRAGGFGSQTLGAAYAGADAVAYVSLYEGFGLPVLEAMSVGAPVLTSNVGAIAELADDAAVLVDPTDEDAIADGLRRILTEPSLREDLSRRGRERAAGFSWEATASATLQVYRSL